MSIRSARLDKAVIACCPLCGAALKSVPLIVNLDTNCIVYGDRAVRASPKHCEIVSVLLDAMPRPTQYQHLISRVWGANSDVALKTVHTTVCFARRMLEKIGWTIESEYGVGYKLVQK